MGLERLGGDEGVQTGAVDDTGGPDAVALYFPLPHECVEGAATNAGVGDGGGDFEKAGHDRVAGSACGGGLGEGALFFGV